MENNFEQEVKRCKQFICENFLQMPSVRSVSVYSLFFNGGTFTDEEVIKKALTETTPEELYKRP